MSLAYLWERPGGPLIVIPNLRPVGSRRRDALFSKVIFESGSHGFYPPLDVHFHGVHLVILLFKESSGLVTVTKLNGTTCSYTAGLRQDMYLF